MSYPHTLGEKQRVDDWIFERFGPNFVKIYPANGYLDVGAGLTVTKELKIPFTHRWTFIAFRHTDNTDADSTDSLDFTVRRPKTKNTPSQFEEDLLSLSGYTDVKSGDVFGVSFEREPSIYQVIVTSVTASDRCYCVLYCQVLGEWKDGK